MFSRGTIVLVFFAIIVAAIIGLSQFLQSQPPYEITIAVNPIAEDWMQTVIDDFNESDVFINGTTRIQVNLTTTSDMSVWYRDNVWSFNNHPDAWMPASSATLGYVDSQVSFETLVDSSARSPLVWGGFNSRVSIIRPDGALDWDRMAQVVQTDSGNWASLGGDSAWGFLKFAYPRPANNISGLAVLLAGAGHFHETTALSREALRDEAFITWMASIQQSVPNFQTLGSDPASVMASRGTSAAEFALLPEVLWLKNISSLSNTDPIVFNYPDTQFILDFPIAAWQDPNTPIETQQATRALADFIMARGQDFAPEFGLRPAQSEPTDAALLFLRGQAAGILLEPDYGQIVQPPEKNAIEILLERFG